MINPKKNKKIQLITAIIVILLVLAMVLTGILGALL